MLYPTYEKYFMSGPQTPAEMFGEAMQRSMVDPTGRDPVPEVVCKEFTVKSDKYGTVPVFVIRPPGTEDELLPALIYT